MKSKFILGCSLALSMVFFSCQKELKPQDSTESSSQDSIVSVPNPEQVQTIETMEEVNGTTNPTPTPSNVAAPVQNVAAPAQTAPGMNPPHGQPGHICEIPVGAPLSSAPPKAPAPVQPQQQVSKPATIQQMMPDGSAGPAQVVETAPGMNPPHGQPGHICEIPVGSPLPQ